MPISILKGVSATAITNIPEKWDRNWFRDFIRNFLVNIDLRNTSTGTTNINAAASVNTPATVFTNVSAGTVPASGGGTTNFLGADGIWRAPTGAGTSPGGVDTNIQYNSSGSFAGASNFTWNNGTNTATVTGTISATSISGTTINATSDPSMKKDIELIKDYSNILDKIRGYRFKWRESDKPSMGVMSTEVKEVAPELISRFKDHDVVNYNGLIAVLIEEVKTLRQRITNLETKI